jgi:PAS domain S-box-containing protein
MVAPKDPRQGSAEHEGCEAPSNSALFELLLHHGDDAIFIQSLEGGTPGPFLEVNQPACERLGYTRQELLRMSPREVDAPEWRDRIAATSERLLEHGRWKYETVHVARSGARIPVEVNARLFEHGRTPIVVSIARDLSERQDVERRLARERKLLETVMGMLPDRVYLYDVRERKHRCFNRGASTALDPVLQDLHEGGIDRLLPKVHPDDVEAVSAHLERMSGSQDEALLQVRFRIRSSGTEDAWLYVRERVYERAEGGRPEVVFGICQDISAVKQAESELLRSRKALSRALRVAHVGSWYLDLLAGRLEWSEEAYRIFGIPVDSPVSYEVFLQCVHPQDRAEVDQAWKAAVQGTPYDLEHRIVVGGEVRWVREQAEVEREPGGTPVAGFGTVQDITERKQLEEQFLQAQKMETVGRLAGGVAHDFNNLLTVIGGNAELAMLNPEIGPALHEELSEIKKASQRAAELTQNLLAFSRRQAAESKVVDLNTLIGGMERMLKRLIGEHIEMRTHAARGLLPVRIDPGQMEQVLTNLVVNARDAMARGGRLTIETLRVLSDDAFRSRHPDAAPGDHAMLVVSDNGVGMTDQVRSHLFEPFFTTKPKGRGTGLGLSTCCGIVKQHGGHIWVSSEPMMGTTVQVLFPLSVEPSASETRDSIPAAPRGRETVVLVEDDASIRRLTRRILVTYGYSVITAANGQEALVACEAPPRGPFLLITDVVLPGMSGRELADQLLSRHPRLRVLFVSGYSEDAIGLHGVLDPGIAFLAKPYSPDALARKVRQVLDA